MENLKLTENFEQGLQLVSDNTPEGTAALQLHFEIKASFAAAASAMVEFAGQLKTMRDQKLYEHIGFGNFEEYVEKAHGIKQRQAYTYIQTYEKLRPKLMLENAELGITKLALLCGVSAVEREEFIENNDLEGLTVDEVKALIEQNKGLSEQISLLLGESEEELTKQELLDKELGEIKAELAKKDDEIANLKAVQEPIDVAAVETEKIEQAVAKREKELQAQFEKDKALILKESEGANAKNLKAKNDKAIEKARAEEREKAVKEIAKEFEAKETELAKSVKEAQEQAEKLEKQLKIAGNQNTVKFNLLFAQIQQNILGCMEIVKETKATDEAMAEKLLGALRAVVGQLVEE